MSGLTIDDVKQSLNKHGPSVVVKNNKEGSTGWVANKDKTAYYYKPSFKKADNSAVNFKISMKVFINKPK